MAKPKRKAPKSKPVTQHQLFPAVVALWFGALFGLGSLAVRPSLLEEFVIKSRIDLLVPAAAPPLGMTSRMLVALTMAALGAMLGTVIARRIAKPRPEVRERKRTNLSTRDEGSGSDSVNAYADASTRYPGPAEGEAAAPGMLAGRRRSLAIEHEEGQFVPHDNAPLPGGAPQIFDIAASGLNDAAPAPAAAVELGSYAQPPLAAAPAAVPLDWAKAAPVLPPVAPIAAAPAPGTSAPAQPAFAPEPAAPGGAFVQDSQRQVFGAVPPATPPVEQPRQIFGAPVTDDHVPREFIEAQGFRTSVFVAPKPSPLFPARLEAAPVAQEPAQEPPVEAAPVEVAPAALPAPVAEAAPDPASLGIEDLSSRLAESMRRRRASRAGAPAEPAAAAVAESAPEPPVAAEPEVSQAATAFAVPQAFEPEVTPPQSAPEAAAEAIPAFTVPPFVVPPFSVPAAETEAAAVSQPIPAALRPLDLTGFEEDDVASQDSLLPPRRIAFPIEVAPAAFAPPLAVPAVDESEVAEDVAVAEENYASLLGVTPSPANLHNPFVRIEEPETEAEAIEPVVIFPGQAIPAANPFTAPAAASAEEATPFRRFDAPASAGHGQPIAAIGAANAAPREEAELALRSALANLQRMSGAA